MGEGRRKDTDAREGRAEARERRRRRACAERLARLMAAMPYKVTGVPTDADGIARYMEAHSRRLPLTAEEVYWMNVTGPFGGIPQAGGGER